MPSSEEYGSRVTDAKVIRGFDERFADVRACRVRYFVGGPADAEPIVLIHGLGGWGVSDPAGLDPAAAQSFLDGPLQHTDTVTAGRALVVSDPRLDLGQVRCPCLCLWGACDNWVPLQDGMEYARRLRAPLRTIADCGHLLIGERPDAVLDAVRGFLAQIDD